MSREIWKDIIITDDSLNTDYYKGLYQVSNLGRFKSLERITPDGRRIKEKLLNPVKDKQGYMIITLSKNGKAKTHKIHRLIAMAFIPNPENKPCIDHIDTNRDNNSLDNLRWVTQKENSNNEISIKNYSNATKESSKSRNLKGSNNPAYGTHTNGIKVICLDDLKVYESVRQASEYYDCDNSVISKICRHKKKSTHGLHFMYYDEYLQANTESLKIN